ncbi:hypothetical protein Corgl_1176 [Coriobacterium glomerans PW2]|uniref:Uncharacterized protein n=1 Tax=Coriobacterium glomerans (strain ATCC 49209 / DSM 20642 / JCM 10262 / PW2) TaxID=700015 RepID=F2N899_CORGP|nr:hypothetical protein [Coriobacterium glomerans]AEB07282.1 hypothetical protein Corgl_1176 [Coriobacterium glomerans PW2]
MDTRAISYVLIAIMAAAWIIGGILKRATFGRLRRLLAAGDFDGFEALVSSRLARLLYPPYNLSYMRLNASLMQDDFAAADKQFQEMLSRRLGRAQRTDLVLKAFNFYLAREKKARSEELLEEIQGWGDRYDAVKRECRQMHEIVNLNSSSYIEEMEGELADVQGAKRGRLEYLLALQYGNKGDMSRRDEYLKRAESDSFAPKAEAGEKADDRDAGDAVGPKETAARNRMR